jgi:hypothetical protein
MPSDMCERMYFRNVDKGDGLIAFQLCKFHTLEAYNKSKSAVSNVRKCSKILEDL